MTEENLWDVCRLCLSKEGLMLPIFRNHESADGIAFSLKIMSCAAIEVFADDELPSKICHICVHQVEKSFQFKTMCENSDAFLRSRLKQTNMLNEGEPEAKKERSEDRLFKGNGDFSFSEIPRCSSCSEAFSSYDELTDHAAEKHQSDPHAFFCAACNVPTSCLLGFKTHVNLFHRFKCDRCDRVFKHRKNLRDHTEFHFKESRDCRFCKKNFQSFVELKKHEFDHAEKICKFCGKESDSDESWKAHLKSCVQSYACKFCNNDFQFKKDLIAHVNEAHDESSAVKKCVRCQNSFEDDGEDSHCRNCKTGESREEVSLVCKFCTKSFALKSSLRRHEKSHSGVKPYQCKFCPRKFKDNSTCIVHTRTHTGEHPFRCRECNKDFKQLANLKMHTYRHHKKSGEKELYRDDPVSPDPRLEQSLHLFVSSGD